MKDIDGEVTGGISSPQEIRGGLSPLASASGSLDVFTLYENDYEKLKNHPSINGVELIGDVSLEDITGSGAGVPEGGRAGDLLAKSSDEGNAAGWITPADSAEEDNTRPITAGAVYKEIGNINALLATI